MCCESGFDRKNFIRKLIRGISVKRNSYEEFVRPAAAAARSSMSVIAIYQ
jgi:hypothetical protein